ncbi:flagellar biosynthesis protein FlhF [Hydrogenophaga sp.]|uniref:flagellar biosynthesis protein FlhF n=1 Tax=Hydrogenophaga sp. TaxID=1904254 RepID=UPI0027281907|nr:flagellar biosynthesis protein FlhF [Hydrogenophaga sp.]MDO8905503.1 flagellar biosynthesis protein FlhF [Hydrogenophaga sp.]
MNIQRFTAPTSREAMAKARHALGDSAVILSTRNTDHGFEVMAAAEESLGTLAASAQAEQPQRATARPRATLSERAAQSAPQAAPSDSVENDTEALSMSTLSFQDYVRERMLRKRREALTGQVEAPVPAAASHAIFAAPLAAPAQAPVRQPLHAQSPIQTRAQPIEVPVQRFNAPERPAVAAQMPQPIRTRSSTPPAFEDSTPPRRAGNDGRNASSNVDLNALKDMIEERFNTLAWLGSSKQHPIQSNLMLKLIRSGYSPAMSRAVLERVSVDASPAEAVRWVMDVITRNLKVAAPGAGLCDEGGVISLIGATGVGKTTTAAKLAAQCVKQFGAGSVGLITLDSYRVSGYEQLRAYGRLMGVVAHLAHDRAALKDLLSLLANKRMVIIDTAGLGQRDQRIQDMLDMLDMPNVKKVLVLNAGAHGDTIDDVLTSFQSRSLHGVVLSKVDEAVKLGPAIDALIRHQVVLRGVANGQRVPEDWQNPEAATLVRLSMGSQSKSAYDPQSSDLGLYFSQISTRGIDLGGAHV